MALFAQHTSFYALVNIRLLAFSSSINFLVSLSKTASFTNVSKSEAFNVESLNGSDS
jgi:hypothetical protein